MRHPDEFVRRERKPHGFVRAEHMGKHLFARVDPLQLRLSVFKRRQIVERGIDRFSGDDGDLGVLYLRQASLYVLTGELDTALSRLDRAIELAPDLSSAYFLRAEMYSTLGETEKAVAKEAIPKDKRAAKTVEHIQPPIKRKPRVKGR